MTEKTLRIGTSVDNLIVSRAEHLALRLSPRDWRREANVIEDIPVRLRARRKRQDEPRTESLLRSIATVLINSLCSPLTGAQNVSRSCLKNVAQLPNRDEHQRHFFACSFPCDRSCVACFQTVCRDCSHETLCTKCVFNVDGENNCPNDSFSPVETDCVTAEVNIVDEEQSMWRRVKKGTKHQLDAGRWNALLLSSQRLKPHCIAESLITSTIKNALSRAPREAGPATRVRVRPRDQPEPDLTTEEERRLIASLRQMHKKFGTSFESCTGKSHTCHWWQRSCSSRSTPVAMRCVRESTTSWTPFARKTSHGQS